MFTGQPLAASYSAPFMGGLCQTCVGSAIRIGGCKRSLNVRKREAALENYVDNYADYYADDAAGYF